MQYFKEFALFYEFTLMFLIWKSTTITYIVKLKN